MQTKEKILLAPCKIHFSYFMVNVKLLVQNPFVKQHNIFNDAGESTN